LKAHSDLEVTMQKSLVNTSIKKRNSTSKMTTQHQQWVADQYSGPCPIRQLLDRIGDTWTVLVVLKLGVQPLRFRQLLKAIEGISQRMLTVTLRALERDGLVLRTVFDTKPPSVEYRLTELGKSLLDPITTLTHWALANEKAIAEARALFEKSTESSG
jgi:DNA-binding HxlR family transcriptional regulator